MKYPKVGAHSPCDSDLSLHLISFVLGCRLGDEARVSH